MNVVQINNITVERKPAYIDSRWDRSAHNIVPMATVVIDTSMAVFCDTCHNAKTTFYFAFEKSSFDATEAMRKAVEQMVNYDWRRCMNFSFGSMYDCQCKGGRFTEGFVKIDKYAIPFSGGFVDELKQLLNEICQTTNAHYEVNQKEIGDGIVMQQIPTLPPGL